MATRTRMSSDRRREQILDVARDAFRRKGYRTTTMEVAQAAGVSEALVLKHFGSKDVLFRAAVAEPLFDLLERTILDNRQQAMGDGRSPLAEQRAQLQAWAAGWAALIAQEQSLLLVLLREAHEFPDLTGQLVEMLRTLIDDVASSVKELTTGGTYEDFDARVATYATVGALTTAVFLGTDVEAFVQAYFDMLLFGILSPTGRRQLRR